VIFVGIVSLVLTVRQSVRASGPESDPTPQPTAQHQPSAENAIFLPLVFNRMAPGVPPPPPANPHASISQYDGPQTCIACHQSEANHALNSEHVQWNGKWKHVNTYCTAPEPADYACRSCHATTGKVSNLTVNDVDCLICHQDNYQRALGPLTVPVTVTDWQGNTKTYNTPQKNSQGEYQMLPRYDLMPPGTTMTQLARTVHLPTRATCLRCHAKAGGGDGVKRGDLSTVSINPPYTSDVHLSPDGANMLCQDCHVVTNHQIPGKGIDLRVAEGGSVKACSSCHTATPHGNSRLNRHADRVACQVCHIPRYARDMPTEMSRDWRHPTWNPAGCNGQGAWIGEEVKASNVLPAYRFWNGQSSVYDLRDSVSADPDGAFTLARARGTIQDGKLYPIKVHTAYQPRHNASGRMVQYDVLWNFMTGFFEQAAARGVSFMGLSGPYTWVQTRAEQLITHGVAPKANALQCNACHNNGPQMNLKDLGYTLKGPASQVCTQCHGLEDDDLNWQSVHSEHVDEKRWDCSWCHTFSRPERGLRLP
jgi:hypothetical protein